MNLCEDASFGCRYEPNPCCRYVKQLKRDKACGDFDCLYWNKNYWSWEKPGLSRYALTLVAQAFIHFIILYFIENPSHSRKKNYDNKFDTKNSEKEEDTDVLNEKIRIEKLISNKDQDCFMVSSLSKFYKNFRAVNEISFGIKLKECFGLLGT